MGMRRIKWFAATALERPNNGWKLTFHTEGCYTGKHKNVESEKVAMWSASTIIFGQIRRQNSNIYKPFDMIPYFGPDFVCVEMS